MLGTFVALLLLIVGMQLASSSAAAIGGPMSKYISEDMGKKIVTGAAKMPGALVNRGGGRLLDRAGGTNYGSLTGLGKGFAGAAGKEFGLKTARGASKIPVFGGLASGAIASGSAALMKMDKKNQEEVRKKGQDAVKDIPSEQLDMLVNEAADGGDMFRKLPVEKQQAIFAKLATDKRAQDRAKKNLGEAKYDQLMGKVIKRVDGDKDNWLDDTGKAAFMGTKLKHLNLIQGENVSPSDSPEVAKKKKQDAQKKYLDDLNKENKLNTSTARLIGDEAIKDADTMEVLNAYEYREDKDGNNVTIGADMRGGKLMPGQKKAANQKWRGADEIIEETSDGSYIRRPRPVNVEALKPPVVGDPDADAKNAAMASELEYAAKFNFGGPATTANPMSTPEAQEAIKQAVKNIKPGSVSVQTAAKIDEGLLNAGHSASSVFGVTPPAGSPEFAYQRARFEQLMKSNPENVRHFSGSLPDGARSNEVSRVVTETVKPDQVKEMGEKLVTQKGEERERTKQSLKSMENAIKAERGRIGASATGAEADRIASLERAYAMASRYARF